MLIEKYGANIDCKTNDHKTPCHLSAKRNNIYCLKVLIDSSCNINIVDINGNTPLHSSCKYNAIKSVDYLLKRKADYKVINNSGQTALDLANSIEIKDTFYKFITAMRRNKSPFNDKINNISSTKKVENSSNQSKFHRVLIKQARTDVIQKLL